MMEAHYHEADPFRWHLNVFLKAIKEVPDLLQMAMQNEHGFTTWFREQRKQLSADPLIATLSKHRDFVVHRSMLVPRSHGIVGIIEGRGFKLVARASPTPLSISLAGIIECRIWSKVGLQCLPKEGLSRDRVLFRFHGTRTSESICTAQYLRSSR